MPDLLPLRGDYRPWNYGSEEIEREQNRDAEADLDAVRCDECGQTWWLDYAPPEPWLCPVCTLELG